MSVFFVDNQRPTEEDIMYLNDFSKVSRCFTIHFGCPIHAPSLGGGTGRIKLERLIRDKGMMLAVCMSDYGEMTKNGFSTYYELQEAIKNDIDVLPLRVQEDWRPNPPCGESET